MSSADGLTLRSGWPLILPVLIAVPGLALRFSGAAPTAAVAALLLGAAVVGAAFYLSWGTELAERDIGQGLALALLALIAVLPEYAVDTVFAWKAGQDPDRYAPLALANMTGANRILIGVGWSVVVLAALTARRRYIAQNVAAVHSRGDADTDEVRLEPVQTVEIAYLAVASLYALTFAVRSTINVLDTVILFGIFGLYLVRVGRIDDEDEVESELIGPARSLAGGPAKIRRWAATAMLVLAAAVILSVAEQFADSLVASGQALGVSEFLLVQWVAPLASETPEFIAVLLLAWKLRGAAALGALISSKINQWTLLVGIIPLVFAASAGSMRGLPIDAVQREELFLTAAQSMFAVSLVAGGALSRRGAWSLLGLFLAQFALAWALPESIRGIERIALGCVYLGLAVILITRRWSTFTHILRSGISGRAVTLGDSTDARR